jgi:hypothetical protein
MITRNEKLLSVTAGAAVVVATLAIALSVHVQPAFEDRSHVQSFHANTVFGSDGKLIGAAPDTGIRTHIQQDGLPE